MFDNIAPKYDFLNRLLTVGIDQSWRRNATRKLSSYQQGVLLDMATGTADLAIMLAEKLNPVKVIGLDISNNMLSVGREKISKKGLSEIIDLKWGDSEAIPFPDNHFDGITVAFGVRNFQNLEKGISELSRVLKKGGKLVVLEFSRPRIFGFRHLYDFYFKYVLPRVGKLTSKDPKAYQYLYESVQAFPDYEKFTAILERNGLSECSISPQTLGICCIYEGKK